MSHTSPARAWCAWQRLRQRQRQQSSSPAIRLQAAICLQLLSACLLPSALLLRPTHAATRGHRAPCSHMRPESSSCRVTCCARGMHLRAVQAGRGGIPDVPSLCACHSNRTGPPGTVPIISSRLGHLRVRRMQLNAAQTLHAWRRNACLHSSSVPSTHATRHAAMLADAGGSEQGLL